MPEPLRVVLAFRSDFGRHSRDLTPIREVAPQAEVVVAPDGRLTEALVADADVLFAWVPVDLLKKARRLRWLHLPSAGADRYADRSLYAGDVIVTTSSGTFGKPIAETTIGYMLSFARNLHRYRDQQREKRWGDVPGAFELSTRTVGIIGLGDIGSEIAKRAKALGMRVVAIKRRLGPPPPYVDALWDTSGLDRLLAEADFVVLALPNTPATRGILSAERIRRMKRGAYVCNVGRGASIDEQALIDALRDGHLGGAAIDAFTTEPLPPKSPLWEMPNVIITPHASGRSPDNDPRRMAIFCENLRRFVAGEPLLNVLDMDAGY
ncbi:MAG TPA: D-2-hydroxyacid dehydrogenase [Limnochordia bacterium]